MAGDKSKRARRSNWNGSRENGIDYSSVDNIGEHEAGTDLALDPPCSLTNCRAAGLRRHPATTRFLRRVNPRALQNDADPGNS